MNVQLPIAALVAVVATALPSFGAVTVVQQAAPAPTYSTTLNFDEPGGPAAGSSAALNAWSASHSITVADAGVGGGVFIDNFNAAIPWLPNNNTAYGAFGLFWTFGVDMTEMSFQAWDTSGPPSPFGGGMGVGLFNDGVEVGFIVFEPAWGGIGNTWYNITTDGGSVFDEVRVLGFGFSPETFMDNMSWNAVPGPGGLAMIAVTGLLRSRRRRD